MRTPKTNERDSIFVCAMKEEMHALQKAGLTATHDVRRCGIGHASAAACAEKIQQEFSGVGLIVSTGFCGALADGIEVGDVVISYEIVDAQTGQVRSSDGARRMADSLIEKLKAANIRHVAGRTVSTREAVFSPAEKRALAKKFDAVAVDMESSGLFQKFNSNVTCCIFVRAVSDTVNDELPREVGEFLSAEGNVQTGKITRFVLKRPTRNFAILWDLKRKSDRAATALTAAWKVLRETIG